jgi:hypothetical protein
MSDTLIYIPVTLSLRFQDVQADTTNLLTLQNGGAGLKVPTGYKFHALLLHAESDTTITGQSIVVTAAADGAALNGPTVTLTSATKVASGTQHAFVESVAAGSIISAVAVTPAGFTPTTAGLEVILSGLLIPT